MEAGRKAVLQSIARLSMEAELELFHGAQTKDSPLMAVLLSTREAAAAALDAMVKVDPADTEAVRKLQNEVQRYLDLVKYTQDLLDSGDQAMNEMEPEDIEEMRALLINEGDT